MPELSAFDLARLLLPEPRGRLLVIGRHPALEPLVHEPWDEVAFSDTGDGISGDPPTAAVLFAGVDPRPAPPAGLPVGAIFRSSPRRRSMTDALVRDAFPLRGRPLIWRAPGSRGRPSRAASPRGRFDLIRLDLLWCLEPLRPLGLGWSVAADRERSLIGRLLGAAGLAEADWQQTRSRWLIAIGEDKVLKIPQDRVERGHFTGQNRQLERLRETVVGKPIEKLFPSDQEELHVGGWVAGLEDRLPGRSGFRSLGRRGELARIFRSAAGFLESWYAPPLESRPVDDAWFDELWEIPLKPLGEALDDEGETVLWREILRRARERAIGKPLFVVPAHGDLWLNNLLVNDGTLALTGIVDWDRATLRGLPLLDLFHLLMWRTRIATPDLIPRLHEGFLRDSGGAHAGLLREHCQAIGLDPSWIRDLFCRYWLGQIAQRAVEFFPGRRSLPHLLRIGKFLGS